MTDPACPICGAHGPSVDGPSVGGLVNDLCATCFEEWPGDTSPIALAAFGARRARAFDDAHRLGHVAIAGPDGTVTLEIQVRVR